MFGVSKAKISAVFAVVVGLATYFGFYSPDPAPAPAKCVPCACDSPADAGAP